MEKWNNTERVKYFNLFEYVDKIKLSDRTLFHLEDLKYNFDDYISKLCNICDNNDYAIYYYWLDQNYKELYSSGRIENHKFFFNNSTLLDSDIMFSNMKLTEKEIKNIHKFVCNHSKTHASIVGEYRNDIVWHGIKNEHNEDEVYWYGAEAQDVPKFMKEFVKFYNTSRIVDLYSDPFLKSALVHLLFVRIHPFSDGNSRTARLLHNLSFTSNINRLYGTNLKLSPLNISPVIQNYRFSYAEAIDNITFNIKDDNNEQINRWLNFILNMYEEQMNYLTSRFDNLSQQMDHIINLGYKTDDDDIEKYITKSKIKKIFK